MDRREFLQGAMALPIACPVQMMADGRLADGDARPARPRAESATAVGQVREFVHLRVHTEFSLCDGIVRVPQLMAAVSSAGMQVVALTDQSNLFAVVKFYKEAQVAGIKPLIGVDAWIRETGEHAMPSRITLLCQSLSGYRRLTQLVSRSFLECQRGGPPMLERAWLDAGLEGLIVLSGGAEGDIGLALARGRDHEAARCVDRWLALCGDRFYLEVTRTGRPGEDAHAEAALALAHSRGVSAVATNDVRFLARADFEAHEARVCIHDSALLADSNRPRRYSEEQYLKSPSEMAELFLGRPELLKNSVDIAKRCSLDLKVGVTMLPAYPLPAGNTIEDYLRDEARRGLAARRASKRPNISAAPAAGSYLDRLDRELGVICKMGFAGHFVIAADFIRWARANDVAVGPGRGSDAGSLVAYVLGITDLDPIEHDLLFERFLNPARAFKPEFDFDFCLEGRDKVIEYVAAKYGRERVSQIITYGTLAAKAAVRDVGRVLGHKYGYVDRIATLIPAEIGITLDAALEKEQELKRLYENDKEVRKLIDLARALEGIVSHLGTHAGGVVIAPSVLTDFTAVHGEGSSTPVIQFDQDDADAVGLVKFNFLGLRTLTTIHSAVRKINAKRARSRERPLLLSALRLDDAPTYQLIRNCDTEGIFQLQSCGMRDLISRLEPDQFGDLVALVALLRPGPRQSGMLDDFIARKHDPSGQALDCLHVDLRPALKSTYGVILYPEQVMQIAHTLAGYSLREADLFHRAFAKRDPEEIARHRAKLLRGAMMRGLPEQQAVKILESVGQCASHTFTKSHAIAYALLTYQTAWLKAHYREAFMAAVQRDEQFRASSG